MNDVGDPMAEGRASAWSLPSARVLAGAPPVPLGREPPAPRVPTAPTFVRVPPAPRARLPMRRSRTVYALLARCPRFAPRTRATSSLAPPAPWNMPSRIVRTFTHSRVRTAHTISIRRLAWGRTRVKGGNRDARAFRLPLSREGELYTAVRRFGLEVFQLPPSHEGELEIRIPSGRHMNISTPALTRGRTTPQSHNHQTRRLQLPPHEKRSPHIRGERSER